MRQNILKDLSALIVKIKRPHPVRVAIDGVDASGKTILANELKQSLEKTHQIIRASIDGFHNPKHVRYKRGKDSPEGYYYDSFNYEALVSLLLKPLGPDGNSKYRKSIFDFRTDSETPSPTLTAPKNSILLFDGVFLLRDELSNYWDFKIFVDADFEETVRRASERDKDLFGSSEKARERYLKRYVPGQEIYLKTVNPKALADVIVKNGNPEKPVLLIN